MSLEELRDALAKATGPDKVLDHQLERHLHGLMSRTSYVPRYTASLDAAVTLVPEGWVETVGRLCDGHGEGTLYQCGAAGGMYLARAATPALALCLARIEYEIARKGALQ